MLHSPVPSADRKNIEEYGPEQLLQIFASFLKTGAKTAAYRDLPDVWAALFLKLYLSVEDFLDCLTKGEQRLKKENIQMLREFIHADCTTGGVFTLDVIKAGGKVDRAALITIADLADIAAIGQKGTTGLHLLADACDRSIRPLFIVRAGRKLLSTVYDGRGMPVLFTILGLTDLCRDDLAIIAMVFTENNLADVMSRSRTGKTALDVFNEASLRLKCHEPGERNKFFVSHAVKTTNPEGDIREQTKSTSPDGRMYGTDAHADGSGKGEEEQMKPEDVIADRYDAMVEDPLDTIAKLMPRAWARRRRM